MVGSLRYVTPQNRHDAVSPDAYRARVKALLKHRFGALLVYVDPALTRVDDHYGAMADGLAVVSPYPLMSDQGPRAEGCARMGGSSAYRLAHCRT
jgi:hypothetical protein